MGEAGVAQAQLARANLLRQKPASKLLWLCKAKPGEAAGPMVSRWYLGRAPLCKESTFEIAALWSLWSMHCRAFKVTCIH